MATVGALVCRDTFTGPVRVIMTCPHMKIDTQNPGKVYCSCTVNDLVYDYVMHDLSPLEYKGFTE